MRTWVLTPLLSALALFGALCAPFLSPDLTALEATAANDPDDVDAWMRLASAYDHAGRPHEAGVLFEFVRARAPTHPVVLAWKGPRALSVGESKILGDPTDPARWESAARWAADTGRRQQATTWYLEALRLDPANESRLTGLITTDPHDPRALAWLDAHPPRSDETMGDVGDALRAAGKQSEACGWFVRALQADLTDEEWLTDVLDCATTGPFPDREAMRAALEGSLEGHAARVEADPGDDEALGDWGDALWALDRPDEACETWRRAQAIDPEDSEWTGDLMRCPSHLEAPPGRP